MVESTVSGNVERKCNFSIGSGVELQASTIEACLRLEWLDIVAAGDANIKPFKNCESEKNLLSSELHISKRNFVSTMKFFKKNCFGFNRVSAVLPIYHLIFFIVSMGLIALVLCSD